MCLCESVDSFLFNMVVFHCMDITQFIHLLMDIGVLCSFWPLD